MSADSLGQDGRRTRQCDAVSVGEALRDLRRRIDIAPVEQMFDTLP
ncbi:hypothetical protein [Streptomyces sp. YIM 121038]|nr:hypothetical protein [Streptomyces sp. YIM 121038]